MVKKTPEQEKITDLERELRQSKNVNARLREAIKAMVKALACLEGY